MAAPSSRNPQSRKPRPARSLCAQALAILARREHSRDELAKKLAPLTEDSAEIPELLDDFERRGWLSEARVVEQVMATRRRRFGSRRITQELREKGLSEDAVAGARESLKAGEVDAARAVWRRKFPNPPVDARDKARQMRFLQGRGFSLDTIRKVISGVEDD